MDQILSPAQAEAAGYISIADALKQGLTDKERTTLYRQAVDAKTIPSCLVKKGTRQIVWVLKSALTSEIPLQRVGAYSSLLEQWQHEMKSGAFTGKPQSNGYAKLLNQALNRYWAILDEKPSFTGINAANFRQVINSKAYEIDEENQVDHFSGKMHIYKALTRFTDFLIREGLKTQADREELERQKPKQRFKVKKTVLENYQVDAALEFNLNWRNGRHPYDILLMDLLIALYAFAGIRASEAIKLKMEHVLIKKKLLHIKGKGGKDRFVPIHPSLLPRLENWLKYNRPETESNYFLLQKNHDKLTISLIGQRFRRFAKVLKDPIHPHALRRAFATIMSNQGMPLALVQLVLGHEDIKTTMSYTMSTLQHAQNWMNDNLYAQEAQLVKPEQEKSDEILLQEMLNLYTA
jgi:site-specific recombinase XerD